MHSSLRTIVVVAVLSQVLWSQTKTVVLDSIRDNTLFESATGSLSAGADAGLFSGITGLGSIRRGLILFDIAGNIPDTATIQNVTLTLQLTQSGGGNLGVGLHTLLADWGEAGSIGGGMGGGAGGTALPGDATWIHTFSTSSFWTNLGGDFTATSSALTTVGSVNGPITWSSTGMVADTQAWLDNPLTNFGWAVVSDEISSGMARRFATREHGNLSFRPQLSVTYIPRAGSGEDFVLSGSVNGPLTLDPDLTATANDALFLHIESPMGAYDFFPHLLTAQLFTNGSPPFQAPFFPELYLDFTPGLFFPVIYLYSALANPFATAVLPPGGQTFVFAIPAGLNGLSLMIQAYSTLPSMNTGSFFTATDAFQLTFF